MSEQDPFVIRTPNGTLFSYGNAAAAQKIDVDAQQLELDEIEFARTEPLPNPATLTVGDMIKAFTFLSRTPPEWRKQPAIGQMLLRREMMLSASAGWRAFEKWVQRKHGCHVTIEIAQAFRGELCRLLGKDFDEIEAIPLLESVHQLEHPESARPPAPPREDEQPAAVAPSGNVALEPAPPKYSLPGGQWLMVVPDDPPPYEIPVEGLDGRRQVIQMGAKPLKFGHMIVLLDDLKLLFDRFRESSTSATQDNINRFLGLLYSDPGFERFREWANIEFGRQADADAAHELKKRLSTKLRILFDTLDKLPVVEVMRLVDEHLAVPPASEDVTPEAPKGEPAADTTWTPERIERFVEAIEALKRDAMAHRDLGPVAVWGDGCSILFRWLGALFLIRDHENWRAVLAASYSHVVDLWQSVITLTSRVATVTEVAGGNARTIIECGNMFTETISALPRPPDMSRLGPAWGKAVNELVYLGQRTAVAATSKPVDGELAAVAASGVGTPPAELNFNLPGRSAVSASAAEDDAMALVRMGLNLSNPPAAVAALGTKAEASSNTKRKGKRGPRKLSKVQKALVILKYRAKRASESIRVEDIAIEVDCTPQNLYKSLEFQKEWDSARARRIRRGWKVEGVADCVDESTLDVG
jgi:hypothetical protein